MTAVMAGCVYGLSITLSLPLHLPLPLPAVAWPPVTGESSLKDVARILGLKYEGQDGLSAATAHGLDDETVMDEFVNRSRDCAARVRHALDFIVMPAGTPSKRGECSKAPLG